MFRKQNFIQFFRAFSMKFRFTSQKILSFIILIIEIGLKNIDKNCLYDTFDTILKKRCILIILHLRKILEMRMRNYFSRILYLYIYLTKLRVAMY